MMSLSKTILLLLALAASLSVVSWQLLIPATDNIPTSGANVADREPHPTPPGMVWIPGGKFLMGSRDGNEDERPVHEVELTGFWMDATEVTNAEYKRFTDATGYVTLAERTPKREDFIGLADLSQIRDEDLVPSSICFNPNFDREAIALVRQNPANVNWPYLVWKMQKGANWRHPNGPESTIDDKLDHPVVHIAWDDAIEYCKWAGKRLPTEAEYEYAARGGLSQKEYPWGDTLFDGKQWRLNVWQGEFPVEHTVKDGFEFTAPVKSFPPNNFGLYDITGNVWEWCSDWYQPGYYADSPRRDPRGPVDSFDRNEPGIPKRVQRGGSFMCNANYCLGYRCAARMKGEPTSASFHCGFRCVLSAADYEAFVKAPRQQPPQAH